MSMLDERHGARAAVGVGLAIVVAAGLLDYLTPANVDFSEFYMIAVIVTAWAVGFRTGLAFALLVACMEFGADTALRVPTQSSAVATAHRRPRSLTGCAFVT